MDRNRSLATFHGPNPPVYKDPGDVATEPLGTFQTDLTQPLTPLTPEHANLITEELRNLTEGLGFTPASNVDTQLRDAIVPALKSVKSSVPAANGVGNGFAYNTFQVRATTANAFWHIPLSLPVGARITDLWARGHDDATAPNKYTVHLNRLLDGGLPQTLDSITAGFPAAYTTLQKTLSTPHVVADNYIYWVSASTPAGWDGTSAVLHEVWLTMDLCGAPPAA